MCAVVFLSVERGEDWATALSKLHAARASISRSLLVAALSQAALASTEQAQAPSIASAAAFAVTIPSESEVLISAVTSSEAGGSCS